MPSFDSTASFRILPWLQAAARANGTLSDEQSSLRYADAAQAITAIQAALAAAGVARNDCVTAELTNDLHGALLMLALLDAGLAFVPVPPRGAEARSTAKDIDLPTFSRWRASTSANSARTPRSIDGLSIDPDPLYRQPATSLSPDDPAAPSSYWNTSGSLGAPKLVVKRHDRLVANGAAVGSAFGLLPSDRISLPIPICHRFGSGMLLAGIAAGASIELQQRSNLLRFLEREDAFGPTVAFFTPLQCESLIRARRRPRPYRLSVCGGDCIAAESARRFEALHGPLTISYGSTEFGSVAVTGGDATDEARRQGEMLPLPGIELRIEPVANEDERRESTGGVLHLRGPHGFDGYVTQHGTPIAHRSLLADRWFRTGDIAAGTDGGCLRVLGRHDLSINRNGLLLPLADVESRAREVGAIGEAVAVAGGNTLRGRELVLFCTVVPGHAGSESAVRSACAERLPDYAVPDRVKILSDLPRLASGKPDRRALAALL